MKPAFQISEAEALTLFREARAVQIASTTPEGAPVLRTFNAFLDGNVLVFHAGRHGDKMAILDRPCEASVEQIVAQIPSYFVDPERACPATTFYKSAKLRGCLTEELDLEAKFRCMQQLMARFQPEGGFVPLLPVDRGYRSVVAGLLVVKIVPTSITGKAKLGQHRSRDDISRVLTGLWRRGAPGDVAAIEQIRGAYPGGVSAEFLHAPGAVELVVAPNHADAVGAAHLLHGQYWTEGETLETLAQAQLESDAWVVARRSGRVIASARALGDKIRAAHVKDVIVAPEERGQGLGRRLMELLLDHPRVRAVKRVELATRDAQNLYARLGFEGSSPRYAVMMKQGGSSQQP